MTDSRQTAGRRTPSGVEIVVAQYAGYCYGVERALKIAEEARLTLAPPIYTLGPLIHNPSVVERLANKGIRAISSLDEAERGSVIVRAHGVAPEIIDQARQRGLNVIDATCPFVGVAQRKARELHRRGYLPLILGEREHPEVTSLKARAGEEALVVEGAEDLPLQTLHDRRVGVVVQTTQTREKLAELAAALAPVVRELLVFNTICDATGNRQDAARELASEVDAVVVVGGRNSANTTHLADLCQALQPRTWHVETAAELQAEWFAGCRRIGVVAGASTPEGEIQATVRRIEELVG